MDAALHATPPFYTPGAGCTVSCRAVTSLHLPRASKIFKGNCGVAKIQPTVQEQQHQRRYSEGREPADGADAAARGGEAGAEVSGEVATGVIFSTLSTCFTATRSFALFSVLLRSSWYTDLPRKERTRTKVGSRERRGSGGERH